MSFPCSDVATGVWANSPTFYQDGARDFYKITEKICRGEVANLQRKGVLDTVFFKLIYNISLNITSANLTKKQSVLGWLTKKSNKHNFFLNFI